MLHPARLRADFCKERTAYLANTRAASIEHTHRQCSLFDVAMTCPAAVLLPQVMTYLRWSTHAELAHNELACHMCILSSQKIPENTTTDIDYTRSSNQ